MSLARVRLTVMAAIRSLFTLVEKIRLSLEETVGAGGPGWRGEGQEEQKEARRRSLE